MVGWRTFKITQIRIYPGRFVGSLDLRELRVLVPWMVKVQKDWERYSDPIRLHFKALSQAMQEKGIRWEQEQSDLASAGESGPSAPERQKINLVMPQNWGRAETQALSSAPIGTQQSIPKAGAREPVSAEEHVPVVQPPSAPIAKSTSVERQVSEPTVGAAQQSEFHGDRGDETPQSSALAEQIGEQLEQSEQLSTPHGDERLNCSEQDRLAQLEEKIEKGLGTFVEVGTALVEVRDRRLYREVYSSFEVYCQQRWGIAARRARQLMAAAEVVKNLKAEEGTLGENVVIGTNVPIPTPEENVTGISTLILPTSEGQTRSLSDLGREQQREVWQKAVEVALGTPSARQVREVRDKMFPRSKRKPKKMKREPASAESVIPEAAESETPTISSEVVPSPSVVSETSSREGHLRALWSLFELLIKGKDEVYDERFLEAQQLDVGKFWAAWRRFGQLARQVKTFAEKKPPSDVTI
jgi:hypothetical protein